MSEITHTTIATWVMPILKAIEPFCDNSKALEQVGIDPNSISDSNQRIPLTKMRHLWKLAEDVSGDDCIGLEVIKYISPTSFHAIYNAHHASSSMRESLERLVTFSRIISTMMSVHLKDEAEEVVMSWTIDEGIEQPSIHATDAFMGLLVMATQSMGDPEKNNINSICMTRPKPRDCQRHDHLFNCPIRYECDSWEIRFSKAFVDKVVPTGNTELVRINEQVLSDYMSRFNKSDIVASVYNTLVDLMPHGEPTREKVANKLGTSSRSLNRKLNDLGTSFKTLLDDSRKHLAIRYISQSELSITSITYQLGFSSSSCFSRSFKRWTGSSPSEYRKNNAQ